MKHAPAVICESLSVDVIISQRVGFGRQHGFPLAGNDDHDQCVTALLIMAELKSPSIVQFGESVAFEGMSSTTAKIMAGTDTRSVSSASG
ncbi:hypothetical protein Poly21_46530 [Allorhodopirellula heiligendammensis]|uniref:Uncharacterized protein n=1 Tax=Allorhodopirellula heiligendammensis TaxID=2714739 RepID=A0A5C6BGH9_9BACT|nr:hypothetical protein Poly21_46530 [Allorhodopirellula heiligendammensis]